MNIFEIGMTLSWVVIGIAMAGLLIFQFLFWRTYAEDCERRLPRCTWLLYAGLTIALVAVITLKQPLWLIGLMLLVPTLQLCLFKKTWEDMKYSSFNRKRAFALYLAVLIFSVLVVYCQNKYDKSQQENTVIEATT